MRKDVTAVPSLVNRCSASAPTFPASVICWYIIVLLLLVRQLPQNVRLLRCPRTAADLGMELHTLGRFDGPVPCGVGLVPCGVGLVPCGVGIGPCGVGPCDVGTGPCGVGPCDVGVGPCVVGI